MTSLPWSIIFMVHLFIVTVFGLLRAAVHRHHLAQASTLAWFLIAVCLGSRALFPQPLLAFTQS